MKVKEKTALLLKGVSMKDIKELEEQEKLELEQDALDQEENQETIEKDNDEKPEEESTGLKAELIDELTEMVSAAVVEKLQLENINRDHSSHQSNRTPEEVAKSIFKTYKKEEK